MKPKRNTKLIAFSLTTMSLLCGCQSGFTLRKPDLSRLAFWKNDELSLASRRDDIPPPSAHFAPDGEMAQAKDDLKSSIDDIIAEAKRNQQATAENAAESIRKPYSLDSIDPKLSLNHSKSTEDALNETLQQFKSTSDNAFKTAEKVVSQGSAKAEETTNMFNGWNNTFQPSNENAVKNVAQNLQGQAEQIAGNATNSFNSFAKSATSAVSNTVNNTVSTVSNSVDNSFQPSGTAAVVSNPFARSNQLESKAPTAPTAATAPVAATAPEAPTAPVAPTMAKTDPAPTNSNDFSSDFNQMMKMAESKQPLAERIGISKSPSPNLPEPATGVQQSSFNTAPSVTKQATNAILQPLTARSNSTGSSSSTASQYPTTSFGVIRSKNGSSSKITTGTTSSKTDDSGIIVPPHLLRGEGNFSPGSTRPLRPLNPN